MSKEFPLICSLLNPSNPRASFDLVTRVLELDLSTLKQVLLVHRLVVPVVGTLERIENLEDSMLFKLKELIDLRNGHRLVHLQLIAEMFRVADVFDSSNLTFVTLKGPAFSQWLFGDPMFRESGDLDILVDPKEVESAESLLVSLGFEKKIDPIDRLCVSIEKRRKFAYHSHFSKGMVRVELHWRASGVDHLPLPSVEDLISEREFVSIGGREVPVLNSMHMLDYLTVHGSAHCWNRLKWIYEIECIFRLKGDDLGLKLDSVDETSAIARWRDELRLTLFSGVGGRSSKKIPIGFASRLSLRQLSDGNHYPGALKNAVRRSLCLLWASPGVGRKLRYLNQLLRWDVVYVRMPLPETLNFLYLILGPIYWLWKRAFPGEKDPV